MNTTPLKALAALLIPALVAGTARASIAYGSINNFDTVNDTGQVCHGFEIEIEDCRSTDLSYTFDYNHYGTPNITQDNSVAGHPKCIIRWESKKNPDGTWAAYTAIPAGPIPPTNGHMFTNPAVNFGGEHFGAGYNVAVGAVRYNWLVDTGGVLVHGGAVQVSTPTFTYYPPVLGNPAPPAVQAVIAPPPPPAPEPKEFGKAVWVKEIRTTTHNHNEVRLRNLLSDDPDDPNDKNWRNGEPDEVETEWQILQTDYNKVDAPNNQKAALPEDLPGGDEVITRRYEFYKYEGPLDNETGEAMAQSVGPDGIHGVGIALINGVEVDLTTVAVVGAFTGSQMAAVDVDAPVGLIDHVGDAEVDTPYAARTLVVEGALPFTCTLTGALPAGMTFDEVSGQLSGTPAASGEFNFTITATDGLNPEISRNYLLRVAAAGAVLPAKSLVDTTALPAGAGITTGDGSFAPGTEVTVHATAAVGFHLVNWTDNGKVVGNAISYTFVIDVNHSLVANFAVDVPQWTITTSAAPAAGGGTSGGGLVDDGSSATVVATPNAGYAFVNWTAGGVPASASASYTFTATADLALVANFTPTVTFAVSTSAAPAAGGTTSGGGNYVSDTSATVMAVPHAGYVFAKWTVGTTTVSTTPSYAFTVTANRALVANFIVAGVAKTITTSASPTTGGTTTGSGTYLTGISASVVATPRPGYAFSKWEEGSTTVSTSATYTFDVTGTRTLVAKFNEAFVITATTSPAVGGTTEMDSLTYKTGENAKAQAFPAGGWSFSDWTENSAVVSTDATYSFRVTGNRTLVAHFTWDAGVAIATSSAPAIGGTTSGEGPYLLGADVTLSAIPSAGYGFANWSSNGTVLSADANYTFPAAADLRLVANFSPYLHLTATAVPSLGGTAVGTGEFMAGDTAMFTATASPGHVFSGWTENGAVVSTDQNYTFTVVGTRALVANFSAIPVLTLLPAAPGSTVLILAWPVTATGWVLQESADVSTWLNSTRPVTPVGDHNTATVNATDGRRFFRLAHP
ncbi:MAG: putative Ig domain-containing protein [Verrucomicrobia bacterium]|nr:putative Ig domain-containing protein [Verrucomicrobiota bacterium]